LGIRTKDGFGEKLKWMRNKMQSGIYSFLNLVNSKRYIGQSVDVDKRIKEHFYELRTNQDNCKRLQNAWNKYGYQNFVVETIISTENNFKPEQLKCFLDFLEESFIKSYDSFHNGYNMSFGGEGSVGFKHSEESKEKISKSKSGEKHPFYGKKRPEHSENMKGRFVGEKSPMFGKEGYWKGKKNPTVSKLMKGKVGDKHPCFGKKGYWSGRKRPDISLLNSKRKGQKYFKGE
jgi:group I intron endonuclease